MTVYVAEANAHVLRLVTSQMVAVLEGYTTEEPCCVLHSLWAKGLNAKDINKEMLTVYGGKCLSRKAVHNWVQNFLSRTLESRK
jgi:hypothetical protein